MARFIGPKSYCNFQISNVIPPIILLQTRWKAVMQVKNLMMINIFFNK